MISELWHRAQPSRKLINTGCHRCPPPPPQPCSSLSAGISSFSSFPSPLLPPLLWLILLLSFQPPREQGCPAHAAAGHWAAGSHPYGSSIPTRLWEAPVPSYHGMPCPGINHVSNTISFVSPLFPHRQSCPPLPFLSFLVTFPGSKLRGAIMPRAKENMRAATISAEDVARRAATQKRAAKFIKLPLGWSTHLQCTRSPSTLSEISLLFLFLLFPPFYKEPNKKVWKLLLKKGSGLSFLGDSGGFPPSILGWNVLGVVANAGITESSTGLGWKGPQTHPAMGRDILQGVPNLIQLCLLPAEPPLRLCW